MTQAELFTPNLRPPRAESPNSEVGESRPQQARRNPDSWFELGHAGRIRGGDNNHGDRYRQSNNKSSSTSTAQFAAARSNCWLLHPF